MTGRPLLVRNGTFAVLDGRGDITGAGGSTPDGLFQRDARHVSRWELTIDGETPTVLVPARDTAPHVSVLTSYGSRGEPPACTVFREQAVTDGTLVARLRVTGHASGTCTAVIGLTVGADFADQFELRADGRAYEKPGAERTVEELGHGVEFSYRRGATWHARTTVTTAPAPDRIERTEDGARRLCWEVTLAPHACAEVALRVTAHPPGGPAPGPAGTGPQETAAVQEEETLAFLSAPSAPGERTGWPELARACEQGLSDLALLHVPAVGPDGEPLRVPGAGVPWFLTLFGRDALLTSLFALPYRPALGAATLAALAATQATRDEPERIAQPGKIVHEIRHGELAHFGQVPYGRYYGSVDSTPLFLVLLGAWTGKTGDSRLATRLEPHARAAVEWMFLHGGLDACGYLVYEADKDGLANQNWKDSPGSVCDADGTWATGSIAAAEVQGYAYDALRHAARLARTVWADPAFADRLKTAAAELRTRFARDFWMADQDFPALALDGGGRQCDALASNAGHLLWSGLLDRERGTVVGRRLLEADFFSCWGIRTLAAGQAAYHPLSYHRGSVWPHDNAVIALGLARYGLHDQARRVAHGLIAAAAHQRWRLPEVLAGYGRTEHPDPVPYPHACSPQAWAAATPLALLTALHEAPGS